MSLIPTPRRPRRTVPVAAHEGTAADFLRRHAANAKAAAAGDDDRRQFLETLFDRLTDTRNLLAAIDHVLANGGDAAGADGVRPTHLDRRARVHLARLLRQALRDGT